MLCCVSGDVVWHLEIVGVVGGGVVVLCWSSAGKGGRGREEQLFCGPRPGNLSVAMYLRPVQWVFTGSTDGRDMQRNGDVYSVKKDNATK